MAATTVLTPALQPAGSYYSSPLAWPSNLLNVTGTVLLSTADQADATKQMTVVMEVSFNGGLSFQEAVRVPWVGNTKDLQNNTVPPSANVGYTAGNTPSHSRIRIELPQTLNLGATLLNS